MGAGRRQVKQSGVDSMGRVWEGCPSKVEVGWVWGYNIRLISIRSTTTQSQKRPRKKWSGRVHPSPPRGNAPEWEREWREMQRPDGRSVHA